MTQFTFKNCPSDIRNDTGFAIRVDYQNEGEGPTFALLFPGELLPGLPDGRTRTVWIDSAVLTGEGQ